MPYILAIYDKHHIATPATQIHCLQERKTKGKERKRRKEVRKCATNGTQLNSVKHQVLMILILRLL